MKKTFGNNMGLASFNRSTNKPFSAENPFKSDNVEGLQRRNQMLSVVSNESIKFGFHGLPPNREFLGNSERGEGFKNGNTIGEKSL